MPCFRPNYIVYNDGQVGRFGGRLTQTVLDHPQPGQQIVPLPCGKCPGCRIDRARHWSDRMLLEFCTPRDEYPAQTAIFVTMTYDDDHLPTILCTDGAVRGNLSVRDTQLFFKRFRKYFTGRKVRYYLSGEYGDHTFRPHYHAILFGFGVNDFADRFVYSTSSETGDVLYESPILDRLWSNGAVRFSVASYPTFSYVGRYILKKQFTSDFSEAFYKGRKPPFSTCSRRPGIGSDYFGDDLQFTSVSLSDNVPGLDNIHKVAVPRVVLEKLRLTNPDGYAIMMSTRREIADSLRLMQSDSTDLGFIYYLKSCERQFKLRTAKAAERNKL